MAGWLGCSEDWGGVGRQGHPTAMAWQWVLAPVSGSGAFSVWPAANAVGEWVDHGPVPFRSARWHWPSRPPPRGVKAGGRSWRRLGDWWFPSISGLSLPIPAGSQQGGGRPERRGSVFGEGGKGRAWRWTRLGAGMGGY